MQEESGDCDKKEGDEEEQGSDGDKAVTMTKRIKETNRKNKKI